MNNKDTVFKNVGNLKVAKELFDFINNEVIPGTEIDKNRFWDSFDKSAHSLSEVNKELLKKRERSNLRWTNGTENIVIKNLTR